MPELKIIYIDVYSPRR